MTSRTSQDASRIVAVIDNRIDKKTRSLAMVETTWGTIDTVGAGEVSVFIYGSNVSSPGFRIIGGGMPDSGDTVKVAIDRATGDRWVMEPIFASGGGGGGVTDHGALTGLADDDHPQYRLESEDHSHASTGLQGGLVSHDDLTGVSADDHHTENHASRHSDAGADEVTVENLGTTATDTSTALAPNGTGGLVFVALPSPSALEASAILYAAHQLR